MLRSAVSVLALTLVLVSGCSSTAPAEAPAEPAAEASTVQPEPSPTPTTPSLSDTVPDGTWNLTEKVASVKGAAKTWWSPVPKKGDALKDSTPWEFSSTCTETECKGTITRASDQDSEVPAREFTWDGRTLKLTRDVQRVSQECTFDDGSPTGDQWTWERRWTYDVTVEAGTDGKPVRILSEVTISVKDVTKASVDCGAKLKPAHQVVSGVATPA